MNFDIFGIHNSVELQLLARLRLGLSYLNEHKFKHNFRDFLNLLCSCIVKPETTSHYLLRCHLLQIEWRTLFNYIKEIDEHITTDDKNQILLGEAKLICWSASPTDPILSKNKKTLLQNFDQLAFLVYYFLLFENKKK